MTLIWQIYADLQKEIAPELGISQESASIRLICAIRVPFLRFALQFSSVQYFKDANSTAF